MRDTSLCASLDDQGIAALSAIGRRRIFSAGGVVAWSGDANSFCGNVVSGALKVTAATEDGREQIVALLHPGDFVGEPFEREAPVTVTALIDSDLCLFPRPGFERSLDAHPEMERALLRRTITSLSDARDRMLSLGRRSATERIAAFLVELIDRSNRSTAIGAFGIDLPVSRGELADYLGLTIETVSRQLARLKSEGIVSFSRGDRALDILQPVQLRAIAYPD